VPAPEHEEAAEPRTRAPANFAPADVIEPSDAIEPGADLLPGPAPAEGGADVEAGPLRLPAHPDSFPLIRQQLAALENGMIAWRGEVWPGQAMDWEVGEAPDPEHPEVARVWRTELRLEMPRLGEIQARIELGNAGLRLQILADSDDHRTVLQADAQALSAAMAAAGLPVTAMEVRTRVA
jgi:hypothetical protein